MGIASSLDERDTNTSGSWDFGGVAKYRSQRSVAIPTMPPKNQ
jgi:hypothetical protein